MKNFCNVGQTFPVYLSFLFLTAAAGVEQHSNSSLPRCGEEGKKFESCPAASSKEVEISPEGKP